MAKDELTHWAFWKYSTYPFVLSGQVVKFEAGGKNVRVKGYDGMVFQPIYLAVGAHGEQLHKQVEGLFRARQWFDEITCNAAASVANELFREAGLPAGIIDTGRHESAIEAVFRGLLVEALGKSKG